MHAERNRQWMEVLLQWVRGPITAVMADASTSEQPSRALQWVRGPITAVMRNGRSIKGSGAYASMGPRSDNRGYGLAGNARKEAMNLLQWVRGPITAVMSK